MGYQQDTITQFRRTGGPEIALIQFESTLEHRQIYGK